MRHVLLLLCIGVLGTANAQLPLDSLRSVWADTTRSSRQRIPHLAQWLDTDSTMTVQKAVRQVVGARMDTSQRAYQRQWGLATLARSSVFAHNRHFSQAIAASKEALRVLERAGTTLDIAVAHSYLGNQLANVGAPGEAAKHQLLALQGYEQLQDTLGQLYVNYALGFSYSTQNINDRALACYMRNYTLVRHRRTANEVDLMTRIADLHKDMGDLTKALAWLDSATYVVTKEGGEDPEHMINWMRGDLMMDNGEFAGAIGQFRLSLSAIDSNTYNKAGQSWIRSRIALAYAGAKEFRAAVQWAKAGLAIAEQHHLRKEELDNLYPLAQAYEGLGNTSEGLRYYKRYHALLDSTINTESARTLSDAALTLDFQRQQLADSLVAVERQRDAEIIIAKERNRRNIMLVAGLFAIVMGTISYRQRRRTQKALKRSDELLLNILPEEVAEELKAKGEAEAVHLDSVTVLFTDFKGFTAMSEQVTARQLVHDLHECFSAFDSICEKHGIEKIKTIGDAYMAAGGLPTPNTTHATDVIHAALEMRDFIAEGKARKIAAGLPYFEIRIGIHTGPVVAGIVGVKKFQYDIWGDTVNTASRMESSGEVGHVNISEATYRLVVGAQLSVVGAGPRKPHNQQLTTPAFTFTPRGKVQAKGKGEMEMYFVSRSLDKG